MDDSILGSPYLEKLPYMYICVYTFVLCWGVGICVEGNSSKTLHPLCSAMSLDICVGILSRDHESDFHLGLRVKGLGLGFRV